jgi:nucleoid-associated protein YgaU
MGLFSFLNGGGKDVLKDQPAAAAATPEAEPLRASALLAYVKQLGLPYNTLTVKTSAKTVTIIGEVAKQEDAEKITLAVGNVKGVETVDNQLVVKTPAPEAKYYTVVKGDTLSLIAKAQYGDMMKYPVIFEANKPLLKDADDIEPGQVLRIPAL